MERVNEFRAGVGLPDLRPIPEPGPDLPSGQQEAIRKNDRWWQEWRVSKGWPLDLRSESVTCQGRVSASGELYGASAKFFDKAATAKAG